MATVDHPLVYCANITWNFFLADSPWPMPHVVQPFNLFMYTQDWKTTLISVYIWETFELVVLLLFNGNYFFFLGDRGNAQFEGITDILIGDVLGGLLGILLGLYVLYLFATPPGPDTFVPAHFWSKSSANNGQTVRSWGLWPPGRLFGCYTQKRWAYRRRYWIYWIQLVLLSVPSALFFALTLSNSGFRIGNLLYMLLNVILLIVGFYWNRTDDSGPRYTHYYLLWLVSVTILILLHFIPHGVLPYYFSAWLGAALLFVLYSSIAAHQSYTRKASINSSPPPRDRVF